VRFLSDAWFARAEELLADVRAPEGADVRMQFETTDAPGEQWALTSVTGERPVLVAGPIDDPDLGLRWSRADARRVWRRELRDEGALTAAEARTPHYSGPPAPFDLLDRPEIATLPRLADATVTAQYVFSAGPFGTVSHALVFEDGRFVRQVAGVVEDAPVRVTVPYEAIAPVRHGERTILDAIAAGTIDGDIGPMAVLAGILESPEFQAAERATDRHGFALAALGALDADPAYTAAMEQLAAETDDE
jgi:hypothetical protein